MKKNEAKSKSSLQSVTNALRVLKLFNETDTYLGISEISRRMKIGKSTAYRLVSTLLNEGFLEQDKENSKYYLGIELLHIGHLVQKRINCLKDAHLYLESLASEVGQTVHLVVLNNDHAMFIDKVQGSNLINMRSSIGMSMPAYKTASGKVLLSHKSDEELNEYIHSVKLTASTEHTITDPAKLEEVIRKARTDGYAMDNEESEEGLSCVSVPLYGFHKQPVAAISISGLTNKIVNNLPEYIDSLKNISAEISKKIGYIE
ncbi:MAG: IclR family transcriptional regulator [Eubacteriales bacterium]|nr:IclR family transcriptional regulator [Eubacteriales bacterium]MDD4582839.1 IclR family transcriptional regulator [Eubacteriales bacterium]